MRDVKRPLLQLGEASTSDDEETFLQKETGCIHWKGREPSLCCEWPPEFSLQSATCGHADQLQLPGGGTCWRYQAIFCVRGYISREGVTPHWGCPSFHCEQLADVYTSLVQVPQCRSVSASTLWTLCSAQSPTSLLRRHPLVRTSRLPSLLTTVSVGRESGTGFITYHSPFPL